ncbi:MAG TPA: hypothetical protein VN957_13095 [Chthoniobacterales bacterium]|nr:hypothetical protein [Chthoniobacterales bacterium]
MLTAVQRKYWDLFSEMPPLRFNWIEPDACEVTKWTIARALELGEEIDAAEAVRRYKAAWKCSQMPAKQPIRKHPTTGMVCGRNYYLPEMLRSMPRLVKGSRPYLEWFEAEMNAAGEPDVVLEAGVKRCDVLMLVYDTGDPFADDRTQLEYIGADTMATELEAEEERELAEEKKRVEEERKQLTEKFAKNAPKLRNWFKVLVDPDSNLARTICKMPLFNNNEDNAPLDDEPFWGPLYG